MVLSLDQKLIVDQLIHQEEMISELYEIFANQFVHHASFWKELSLAEVRHAKLLRNLKKAVDEEKILFDQGTVTLKTLDTFLSRLDGLLLKAKKEEFTLQTALSCAVDYETSLVEKNVFSLFDSPHKKFKEILQILQSETEKHVDRIKNTQRSVAKISENN